MHLQCTNLTQCKLVHICTVVCHLEKKFTWLWVYVLFWALKNGRFPEGSKKRKSNNDYKHGHGQEERRPSTLC